MLVFGRRLSLVFLDLYTPGLFWSSLTWGFFGVLYRLTILERFTSVLFRSALSRGFFRAHHHSGFWSSPAWDLFGVPVTSWELSNPGLLGSASPRSFFRVHHPWVFWELCILVFLGALQTGFFLEPSVSGVFLSSLSWGFLRMLQFFGSSPGRGFFRALHLHAFLECFTILVFGSPLCFRSSGMVQDTGFLECFSAPPRRSASLPCPGALHQHAVLQ